MQDQAQNQNTGTTPNESQDGGRSTLSWVIIGVLAAITIALVLKNSERQELDLLLTKIDAPLIIWFLVFFSLGFGIAYLIQGQKIRKKNKELKNLIK